MSSVMSAAPIAIDWSPTSIPPANSETLVMPAPISTSATPSLRSSSERHAKPVASGAAMIDFTSRCAERTHRSRLRRSEEHTSELQSLMRISYAVFCLKKIKKELEELDNEPALKPVNHPVIHQYKP